MGLSEHDIGEDGGGGAKWPLMTGLCVLLMNTRNARSPGCKNIYALVIMYHELILCAYITCCLVAV